IAEPAGTVEEIDMNALPALTTIATDAIRQQFAPEPARAQEPERGCPLPAPSRWRVALAGVLERAASALAPAAHRPAH
ncbi:MAG: hypothetical protein QOK35_1383, partial [Pseudonocardiales bacterium]|nr:hypothetical protein [Pseudonocardiales bacterium]